MNKAAILDVLRQHRVELQKRFAAKRIGLFGSAARDELREDSDVDVLVEFDGPATFDCYMDLKFYLEALIARPVDLVTRDAVKPRMRPFIERDLVYVS